METRKWRPSGIGKRGGERKKNKRLQTSEKVGSVLENLLGISRSGKRKNPQHLAFTPYVKSVILSSFFPVKSVPTFLCVNQSLNS